MIVFFSLVLILRIPVYLGIKGDQFFTDFGFFFGAHFVYKLVYYIFYYVSILREIECNKFVCNKFVLVLVQIDLIQFENSNCIRSICTKTNTNCYIQIRYIQFRVKIGQFCMKLDT